MWREPVSESNATTTTTNRHNHIAATYKVAHEPRDAPRGVPSDTILETVALDAGATYADLRTKLLGSAPEGTTLFAVSGGEQYVLPDLEQTKVVDTDQVWLAREFWRTGEDYDNTRKYA